MSGTSPTLKCVRMYLRQEPGSTRKKKNVAKGAGTARGAALQKAGKPFKRRQRKVGESRALPLKAGTRALNCGKRPYMYKESAEESKRGTQKQYLHFRDLAKSGRGMRKESVKTEAKENSVVGELLLYTSVDRLPLREAKKKRMQMTDRRRDYVVRGRL